MGVTEWPCSLGANETQVDISQVGLCGHPVLGAHPCLAPPSCLAEHKHQTVTTPSGATCQEVLTNVGGGKPATGDILLRPPAQACSLPDFSKNFSIYLRGRDRAYSHPLIHSPKSPWFGLSLARARSWGWWEPNSLGHHHLLPGLQQQEAARRGQSRDPWHLQCGAAELNACPALGFFSHRNNGTPMGWNPWGPCFLVATHNPRDNPRGRFARGACCWHWCCVSCSRTRFKYHWSTKTPPSRPKEEQKPDRNVSLCGRRRGSPHCAFLERVC